MNDDILAFYREQSTITQPGKQSHLFADLPRNIESLCTIVQGLIIHYRCGDLYGCQITPEREREIDTRYVERMLTRIVELDSCPLSEARAPQQRLVGCCRDFATLLCSMLRYQGIPARIRVGFATYIDVGPGFHTDHVVVEYWNESEKRWQVVDAQMDALLIKLNAIDFNVYDMPQGRFLTGGEAWQLCRAGKANPDNFGIGPEIKEVRGWWFVRDKLVQDLAALNRIEMLVWDAWGMIRRNEISNDDAQFLDTVASLTLDANASFEKLRRCYMQDVRVRPEKSICDCSPAIGPHEVALAL